MRQDTSHSCSPLTCRRVCATTCASACGLGCQCRTLWTRSHSSDTWRTTPTTLNYTASFQACSTLIDPFMCAVQQADGSVLRRGPAGAAEVPRGRDAPVPTASARRRAGGARREHRHRRGVRLRHQVPQIPEYSRVVWERAALVHLRGRELPCALGKVSVTQRAPCSRLQPW